MIRQCAWCKIELGTKSGGDPTKTTHGICEKCRDKVREEMKDFMDEPALTPLDTYSLIKH